MADRLELGALEIAERKYVRQGCAAGLKIPRLGTGGAFADAFLWDTVFSVFWARYYPKRFHIINSLDNFLENADVNGYICRQYAQNGSPKWSASHPIGFAPPLLAWAELELAENGLFPGRLEGSYPILRRHHEACRRFRRPDGFYFSDSWGCGMDNIPRCRKDDVDVPGGILLTPDDVWPTRAKNAEETQYAENLCREPSHHCNCQLIWIDTNCQVAFELLLLARIAERLNRPADAAQYREEHQKLADAINKVCWSEPDGFYYDVMDGDGMTGRRHIGAFWALLGQVATPERAAAMIRKLTDPAEFGRPVPIPSLSASDPLYTPESGYWRGPVWLPTSYMVLKGLQQYHCDELASLLARRLREAMLEIFDRTGTIWENYSPEQTARPPENSNRDFCGWSALGAIVLEREF